jgi:hypothetical protein
VVKNLRRKLRIVALAAVALLLLLPGLARAAAVHVAPAPAPRHPGNSVYGSFEDAVYYQAGPGEANRLVVSSGRDVDGFPDITVHDPAADVQAGAQCTSLDAHTAVCTRSASRAIGVTEARLGDGDDELRVSELGAFNPQVNGFGGPGDDLLQGGPVRDELDGGGGRDRLFGGADRDVLSDGDRSGAPGDAGPGPDLMDGGPDQDLVSYQQRSAAVTVDLLSATTAGEPGEGDQLRNIEDADGGPRADRLSGTALDNTLRGHGGADVLVGLDGNDGLEGGVGPDRLAAGNGDDRLLPGGGIDSFSCGLGTDSVSHPVAGEVVGRCEEIFYSDLGGGSDLNYILFPPHPVATSRKLAEFAIGCPSFDEDDGAPQPCAGRLTIREAFGRHRILGRARVSESSRHEHVRVKLNALARRLVRRRQGVFVTVYLRGDQSVRLPRPLPNVAWSIRLT